MGMTDRIYQIHQLLENRRFVTREELLERLGVSWATLKRDISLLRDNFNAPIVFDRELGGYRFDTEEKRLGPQYELPGLWFSAEEIHALLTMQHLLSNLDTGGLLGPHIQPLLSRLSGLLGTADDSAEEVRKRIRIETVGAREFHLDHFQLIGSALLRRKRLVIRYYGRGRDEVSEREVSPQRLVYYRDNWYLDAYCHLRKALRSFSVDGIRSAVLLNTKADDIAEKTLHENFAESYGIFSGKATQRAKLRFTPERARWVAAEQWHGQQLGSFDKEGNYILEFDYNQDPELIMDILKHGSEVEVLGPASLRKKITQTLIEAAKQYK